MKTKRLNIFVIAAVLTTVFSLTGYAAGNFDPQSKISSISYDTENDIHLENWMVDLSEWNTFSADATAYTSEEEIDIENWMLNANADYWSVPQKKGTESEIALESWMTDLSMW